MHLATCGTVKTVITSYIRENVRHSDLGERCAHDVVSGEITPIQSLRHTSDPDSGEMYVFPCKVEIWAINIGCHLTIPQKLRVSASARQAGGVMATPLICIMNGHIHRVSNRCNCKPEMKLSEIPILLGYTASLVDKKWLHLAARRNHG